jgi:hypothetical protein
MSKFNAEVTEVSEEGLSHLRIVDTESGQAVGFARILPSLVSSFQVALSSGADLDTEVYDLDALVETPEANA